MSIKYHSTWKITYFLCSCVLAWRQVPEHNDVLLLLGHSAKAKSLFEHLMPWELLGWQTQSTRATAAATLLYLLPDIVPLTTQKEEIFDVLYNLLDIRELLIVCRRLLKLPGEVACLETIILMKYIFFWLSLTETESQTLTLLGLRKMACLCFFPFECYCLYLSFYNSLLSSSHNILFSQFFLHIPRPESLAPPAPLPPFGSRTWSTQ